MRWPKVGWGFLTKPSDGSSKCWATVRYPRPPRPLDSLTRAEQEVVRLFAGGRSYAQIGEAGRNSAITVRNTIYRVQNKLGIGTRQELVVWAVRNGLLDDHTAAVD